jgi:fumarate hydratase subunit beta
MNREKGLTQRLSIPISPEEILALKVGDTVLLEGQIITGRDTAHKWLVERFVHHTKEPTEADWEVYRSITPILQRGLIYHCGPVVRELEKNQSSFMAAGPTTSIREEPYQGDVMRHFNMAGVIGKGGMWQETLKACQQNQSAYFHAIGGAAGLIAKSVVGVLGVHNLEFGMPEAMWVIEVKDFTTIVTMDAHGASLHENVWKESKTNPSRLLD